MAHTSLWFVALQTSLKETAIPLNGIWRKHQKTNKQTAECPTTQLFYVLSYVVPLNFKGALEETTQLFFMLSCAVPLMFEETAQESTKQLSCWELLLSGFCGFLLYR